MGNQGRFNNQENVEVAKTFKDFLKWQKERQKKNKDYSFTVPQYKNKRLDFLKNNRINTTITWIGHATFLIQCQGLNILTDPVWSNRMGLEKRLSDPGIPIDDLPEIDIIVISHNHYDHLDIKTLKRLKGNPLLLVPDGLKPLLIRKGFKKVCELPWWSNYSLKNVEFIFTPAQHWSKRTLWDTNKSHWGGWVIRNSETNAEGIYFVGDSGYFNGFKEISKRFKIKYMLAPIGAYEPEWFMHIQHTTPEEAVLAFLDVSAKYLIPMHYDAFKLADDTPQEALDRLKKAWLKTQLNSSRLKILELGETIIDN